jgi:hypothetical protein
MTTCTCDYYKQVLKELLDQMKQIHLASVADFANTEPLGQTGTRIKYIARRDTLVECMQLLAKRLQEN